MKPLELQNRTGIRTRQAPVLAIFATRQGEGPCAGDPQVFIRFGGCNLHCDYCDTPESIPAGAGKGMGVEQAVQAVSALDGDRPGSVVSLTGGEPLLHAAYLARLIPRLKSLGKRIYLETNGTLPRALDPIEAGCDWIAMDIKAPSATGQDSWEAHEWFLKRGGRKIFVKLVLTATTEEAEVRRAVDLIAAVDPRIPLVLQPSTPFGGVRSIGLQRLEQAWSLAGRKLKDVRIIPQVHRLWQIP